MSTLLSGPWGYALLLLLVLGLPLQVAVGGLVAMQRRMWTWAVLLVPMLVLLTALASIIVSLNSAISSLALASDPAWIPWFALDDRARATVLAVPGGLATAVLCAPLAVGAAWAGFRAWRPPGSRLGRAIGIGLVLLYALGLQVVGTGAAVWFERGGALFFLALGGPLFLLASVSASGQRHPARFGTAAIGFGALVIGVSGLLMATVASAFSGTSAALGSFEDPFEQIGTVVRACLEASHIGTAAFVLAVACVVGAIPALVMRDLRRLDGGYGVDLLACGGIGLVLLLAAGWAVARERVLSFSAGAHATVVLAATQGYSVPFVEPVPSRVLVGTATSPRWIMMRERGGVDTLPIAGGLDIVGPAVLRNDGLMFPAALPLEDFYLSLFESGAGSVSVVGCTATSPQILATYRRDPLLATGRCGAFPLTLRVTTKLVDPRVLIVLKERFVDDGGDVVLAADIEDVEARDVIVRGQLDATVADLVVTLGRLGASAKVYLGYGVTVEGDDLPIGVDPGLRISKLPQERVPAVPPAVEAGEVPAEPPAGAASAGPSPADIMRQEVQPPG